MPNSIHLTVAALVCRQHRFLCVREEVAGRLVINQPAGHVEPGESLLEAVQRETLEETGWEVEPFAVLSFATYNSPPAPGFGSGVTYYRVNFACTPVHHHPDRALDVGIADVLWRTAAELRAHADDLRSPLVLSAIDDYLSGHHYPLEIIRDYR